MTIINRKYNFIYLKSKKTAGTSVEAHLISQTFLGGDIYSTASEIKKFNKPLRNKHLILPTSGKNIFAIPSNKYISKKWPYRLQIQEHHHAVDLSNLLGNFWGYSIKVTNVRNPWDLLVSAWQWRKDGKSGKKPPIEASFSEWVAAAISGDPEWQEQVQAYDPRRLLHPFIFINGKCAVDILIQQEKINEGLKRLGHKLNMDLGLMNINEKKSNRKQDYRIYYTDKQADNVYNYFNDIIKMCNYKFD